MPAGKISWRISLLGLIFGGMLWLGAANVRVIVGNELLQTGTLVFEEYLAPDAEREIFRLLSIISLVVMSSYVVVVASSVVFLATMPYRLKEQGWLMMSAILFYVFLPVEVFTMRLDGQMIYLEFFTTAGRDAFRELFIARVAALSGVPLIATLCYYTIILLAVFRPLTRPAREA
jgi:hypothetical protein